MTSTQRLDMRYAGFLVPAALLFAVFVLYPLVSGLLLSFTNWDGISSTYESVGMANFVRIPQDRLFRIALRNTAVVAVVSVVLQNVIGLSIAIGIEQLGKSQAVIRTAFFLPVILPPIVIGYVWSYIYSFHEGLLNELLRGLSGGSLAVDWIGNPSLAIVSVAITIVWRWYGYQVVIYMAGLRGIPKEIIDAARVDGAHGWNHFFRITLPMLLPAITVNVLLCTINALKVFDIVFVMTEGGPGNATQVISTAIFFEAFRMSRMGYAAAIGVVLFVLIMVATFLQLKFFRNRSFS